uniref:Fork-head domain-containing protein n=1 Tax=Ganoderma boninense TaxID=34458 RepID=A0A5K1JVR5_9APHY|nr:Fork-head domain-containing protein [Ganoderma boninense]
MPTIPSTSVPLDPLTSVALPELDFFSGERLVDGPTPDPDDDDVIFVQPESGMISQDTLSQCPPQAIAKPHNVDPASLILHSPSSIIGTPFDPSPRFEYPFPSAEAPTDVVQELHPIVPSFHLISPVPAFPSIMPPLPLPGPLPLSTVTVPPVKLRPKTRNFSPTHPKLQARDPPVPPGLKQKLHLNGIGATATIKIQGFDITSLTLPSRSGVGRARGVSLSTLTKHANEPLGDAQIFNSRPETASVTKAGGIGEKQARVANKWKRHTLARCERDREFVVEAQAGAKHEPVEYSAATVAVVDILGGRPTRVPTRPPIPYVQPGVAPSHRPS